MFAYFKQLKKKIISKLFFNSIKYCWYFKSGNIFSRKAEEMLKKGADPNCLLENEITSMHFVVGYIPTKLNFLNLLIKYNGNPNVR